MSIADKGNGEPARRSYECVEQCGNLFHHLVGFTFARCPALIPEGQHVCYACRQPDPHPFHYDAPKVYIS